MSLHRTRGETTGAIYTEDRPLGSGAEAIVHLARCSLTGRSVCVKLFRKDIPLRYEKIRALAFQMKKFVYAARIIEVVRDSLTNAEVGIAIEYCPGESLRDLYEAEPSLNLTPIQKATLCHRLARAVEQFTTNGRIVPIDFSLQNIHLDLITLTPWVIDLDSCWLLKQRSPSGELVDYFGPLGTPGYRAPELLKIPGLLPSVETTLWGLAVVLFHILFGKHPCDVEVTAGVQGIGEDDFIKMNFYPWLFAPHPTYLMPRYDANASEVPLYFEKLFRSALTGSPHARPTAKQWQLGFESWFADELAPKTPFWKRLFARWRLFKRRFHLEVETTARVAAIIAILVMAGALIYFAIKESKRETEDKKRFMPLEPLKPHPPSTYDPPVKPKPYWSPKIREYLIHDTQNKR